MPPAREPARPPADAFAALPDPGQAGTLDELVERLRWLKVWAGDPSYESIKDRVNAAWTDAGRPVGELARKTTVVDCFRRGRRRLNTDLVVAVVAALHPDPGYVAQWRQALRVVGGEARAATQVRVQDALPPDPAEFAGRTVELARLRRAVRQGRRAGAAVTCAIEGMAGVGKTLLAIHAGHFLAREEPFERVLFVNLRGFHPDPAQPPAEPAAVLDGFLRLLGVPGHKIPYELPARASAYRERVADHRALVILDDAADAEQVRHLLPGSPGCLTLVTSRRGLGGLPDATHLTVDGFTAVEAEAFLRRAVPDVPVGPDPDAAARIVRRCGHLPLAVGLIAGHIRGRSGWTLTDHADRLDERHRDRRLDDRVELALDLSYRHLAADQQRLLRLVALHPGQDLDAYAAAALAGTDLPTAEAHLRRLRRDHLLQDATPGRYALHDLVRSHAAGRAADEDPPPARRQALTRLLDHYLATAATAMDTLFPAEAHRRPRIAAPATPVPDLAEPGAARAWLDAERHTLVAVAVHAATRGWPAHTVRLSATLFRYLNGGYNADGLTVHEHAQRAAGDLDDPRGQAHALTNLGATEVQMGRFEPAGQHLQRALTLHRRVGDLVGQARALTNLGIRAARLGQYGAAAEHHEQALVRYRQAGDPTGEARALGNLGFVEGRLGRYRAAAERYEQALTLCRRAGDRTGEASALGNLGDVEVRLGRYGPAAEHIEQAMALYRQRGDRDGEAWTLDSLGILHTSLGRPDRAVEQHRRALEFFRDSGGRDGETYALNGLGEAAHAAGRPAEAVTHHEAAHALALEIGALDQRARAQAGLGQARLALGDEAGAQRHYAAALDLYAELGMPQAEQVRAQLAAITETSPVRR
ncbi:tetratricopeptide repeat protein [Micromonospora sp. NPDC049559]|uniref:tetratricopeptide repeat protein n=1 Tax=Micromonospora sp. NPDC049559 TaxID=3155923 RepID=UPI003427198D